MVVVIDSSTPGRVAHLRRAWRKCLTMTIRPACTIALLGLSETNTIGYYACFQAAIAALLSEGVRARGQWNHEFVHGQFVGVLINQRHLYERELRRVLSDN